MTNKLKLNFTLRQALHRVKKLDILLDIVVADEVVEDYPVSWVKIRGSNDPQYLKDVIPVYTKYREGIDESKDIEDEEEKRAFLEKVTLEMHTGCVTRAIQDWDEEFFERPFSQDAAMELFCQDQYSIIYNQIAHAMQVREDFLPLVSTQPENG